MGCRCTAGYANPNTSTVQRRPSQRGVGHTLILTGVLLAMGQTASAQAWVQPKGEATVAFGWAHNWADHHLTYTGAIDSPGGMLFHTGVSDVSYGITDRLTVGVNLAFVGSRYGGEKPHPARAGAPPYDDGTWKGTFQDFRAEFRFRATTGSLAITPLIAFVAPTRSYEYLGHSAPGRALAEGHFGVSVGRVLDPILPKAYAQTRYVYVVAEKRLGVSHNHSNVSLDMGYFVTSALTASVFANYVRTHGGWRAIIDFPSPSSPDFQHHDQLRRAEYVRLGGALSYALTGSVNVGLSGFTTLYAKSDVNMSGVGLSLSYSFSPSQVIKRRKNGSSAEGPR